MPRKTADFSLIIIINYFLLFHSSQRTLGRAPPPLSCGLSLLILSCERGGPEPPLPRSKICSCALGRSCGPGSQGCVPAPAPRGAADPAHAHMHTRAHAAHTHTHTVASLAVLRCGFESPKPRLSAWTWSWTWSPGPRTGLHHPLPGRCTLMPPSSHMVFI